jgi:integrase/recombinase XerD
MLTSAVESYLAVRRAVGFELRVTEGLLRGFARLAADREEQHVVAKTAIEWAAQAPSPYQRGRRLEIIRLFARHAQAEDARHEIPPAGVFPTRRRPFRPFLFTPEQLHQLLQASAQLPPPGSLRPWTYCTLFSLLAVTGLRISEALRLRLEDVMADGLRVRESKFRKSRLVPLHPSAEAGLGRYLDRRQRFAGADDHVFVSLRGQALSYPTVNAVFLALVRRLGFHPGPSQRGPRLHDLRHGFAVRALEACPAEPRQIIQHMVALSTYMGHAKLASTYWDLHATPRLLTDIADACETLARRGAP